MNQATHAAARAATLAVLLSCATPTHAQTTSATPFQVLEASIDAIHLAMRSGRPPSVFVLDGSKPENVGVKYCPD